ncbi:hypothetical protein [Nonomuraea sp. NPDC049129]|uniref:hypothetical protein n=1 Tax=Nonomuraea sp. NPDC049129 TaxID=3155272 RepID=UPI0033C92200
MTVVSGAFFLFEMFAFFLQGPPQARRAHIVQIVEKVSVASLSALQIAVIAALVIVASYSMGIVLRRTVSMAFNVLSSLCSIGKFHLKDSGAVRNLVQWLKGRWYFRERSRRRSLVAEQKRRGRSDISSFLAQLVLGSRVTSESVWMMLLTTYSEERIRVVLEKHCLKVSINDEVWSTYEYCSTWLARYARDLAPPTRAQNLTLAFVTVVPAALAPSAVGSLWGDDVNLMFWARVSLAIYLLYFSRRVLTAVTSSSFLVVETFRQWVLAQLLEDGKPSERGNTGGPTGGTRDAT